MAFLLRTIVSKNKKRINEDGFNLDLSYITERIIAMGFPSQKAEAIIRNPLPDVRRFLDERHGVHYRIYNLCSEREYDHAFFDGRVVRFPFDDHSAPRFEMIAALCADVDAWFAENPKNVVAIHCKAGKGRTGLMICAYLAHTGKYTAQQALDYYGRVRTKDGQGVTIPSQRRYVRYFGEHLTTPRPEKTVVLRSIKLHSFTSDSALNLKIRDFDQNLIYNHRELLPPSTTVKRKRGARELEITLLAQVPLTGDYKFIIFKKGAMKSSLMLHCWINTRFVQNGKVVLTKPEIDGPHKDIGHKKYKSDFKIEFTFDDISAQEAREMADALAREQQNRPRTNIDDDDENAAERDANLTSISSVASIPVASSTSDLQNGASTTPSLRHSVSMDDSLLNQASESDAAESTKKPADNDQVSAEEQETSPVPSSSNAAAATTSDQSGQDEKDDSQ